MKFLILFGFLSMISCAKKQASEPVGGQQEQFEQAKVKVENGPSYYVRSPWMTQSVVDELEMRGWNRKGANAKNCVDPSKSNPWSYPACCDAKHTPHCVKRDYFPVNYVHTDGKYRHPRGEFQRFYEPTMINRFKNPETLVDKDLLFISLKDSEGFKPFELSQWPFERSQIKDLDRILKDSYNGIEYLIIKPTRTFGGAGVGIVKTDGPNTPRRVIDYINQPENKQHSSWVAQVYIGNPMLFNGKKFHFRIFLMVTRFFGKVRLYTFPQAWIYAALKDYGDPDDALKHIGDKQRHISSLASGQTEHLFPKEILGEDYNGISGSDLGAFLNEQFKILLWESSHKIASDLRCPNGTPQCYDVYGADVMVDHKFNAKLLEINAGAGYGDELVVHKENYRCWEPRYIAAILRKTVDQVFENPREPHVESTQDCQSFDAEILNEESVSKARNYVQTFRQDRLSLHRK